MKYKIQMPVCFTYWDKDVEVEVLECHFSTSLRRVAYQGNGKRW